ncbi:hypothetical protein BDV59DRAFT_185144 [Aspergillus ambiguus]|uniref:uncharacterized protein n=1 Tax=Aspergillus ambiguus TaxID=176160 RepID=UPI003CCDEC31
MPAKELQSPCMDCREVESTVHIRKRHLCNDCYTTFVSYKTFKHMEKYRLLRGLPQDRPCKLLLPLSFGLSSSVLLHMLHRQIEVQRSKPHAPAGFDLHVLVIEPSTISPSVPVHDEGFELVQKFFPLCAFTRLPLEGIFDLVPDIQNVLHEYAGGTFTDNSSLPNKERLDVFRASISTATSRTDVDTTLMTRLIVAFAQKLNCYGIVWGDTNGRLAAKALANVAKGRGASVTWQVADGMSPWGLEFIFPLRELFRVEVQPYAGLTPELARIVIPDEPPLENTLTKNLSIDELMMRYVQTQGEKYPGIMTNVTKTANKLQSPKNTADIPQCALCHSFLFRPDSSIDGAGDANASEGSPIPRFCYACERSRPDLSC